MVSSGDKFRYIHSDPENQLAVAVVDFNSIKGLCYTDTTVSSDSTI